MGMGSGWRVDGEAAWSQDECGLSHTGLPGGAGLVFGA